MQCSARYKRNEYLQQSRVEKATKRARKLEKCRKKNPLQPPGYCEEKVPREGEPVLKRMKMMGPVPTMDDMYNRQSQEVPMHMRCDACQAIVHQGALALEKAYAERKKDDKVSLLTIETIEDLCLDLHLWTMEYGYSPTASGVNSLTGPGVFWSDYWHDEDGDAVVPQTQHSDGIGRRLASACSAVLLGTSPDEEEIAQTVLEQMDAGINSTAALRKLACEGDEQPCAPAEARR